MLPSRVLTKFLAEQNAKQAALFAGKGKALDAQQLSTPILTTLSATPSYLLGAGDGNLASPSVAASAPQAHALFTQVIHQAKAAAMELQAAAAERGNGSSSSHKHIEVEVRTGRCCYKGGRNSEAERVQPPTLHDTILDDRNQIRFLSGALKKSKEFVRERCELLVEEGNAEQQPPRECGGEDGASGARVEKCKSILVVTPDEHRFEYMVSKQDGAGGQDAEEDPTRPSPLTAFSSKEALQNWTIHRPHFSTDIRLGVALETNLFPEYGAIPKVSQQDRGQLSLVRVRDRTSYFLPHLGFRVDVSEVSLLKETRIKFSPTSEMKLCDLPAFGKTTFEVEVELLLNQGSSSSTAAPVLGATMPLLMDFLQPCNLR